ncbi:fungal-specific transcription factor domain-containing protein [Aspergillus spectabilis]
MLSSEDLALGVKGLWTKRPRPKGQRKESAFRALPLHNYVNRWVFLNVTVNDLTRFSSDYEPRRLSQHPSPNLQNHLILSHPQASTYHPLHSFPDTDAYLFDYFIRGIGPSCSLSTSHNPYISLVIPLCFGSETLRNALLAVAANQICLLGRPQFRQEACHYKDKALQGLRREIYTSLPDEGTVATVLMLCFQDISDGCSPSWMAHLRGGLKLMDYKDTHSSPSLWGFFRMYFVAHDIMSRTAFEDCEDKDENVQLWSEGDDLEEIDVLMGCFRGLMTLIHRVSALASSSGNQP